MPKQSKLRKILKIVVGIIVFFTLPSLLFFGFIYFKYNEDLPIGKEGIEADALATNMLDALNFEAYKNIDYLEWTFKERHHYKWHKSKNRCEVFWDDFKVELDFNNLKDSNVFVAEQLYNGVEKQEYVDKAIKYYNNDSFWVVAPFKVFDEGAERRLVKEEGEKKMLLVTYTTGGTTPGDSYLWHFDDEGKPKSFQMWVDIIPVGGLEATWENWITTESGTQLPTFHKLLVFGLEIDNIKTQ